MVGTSSRKASRTRPVASKGRRNVVKTHVKQSEVRTHEKLIGTLNNRPHVRYTLWQLYCACGQFTFFQAP